MMTMQDTPMNINTAAFTFTLISQQSIFPVHSVFEIPETVV